jgi:hypothetical protein
MTLSGVLNRVSGNAAAWKHGCAVGIVMLGLPVTAVAADQWIKPTPEELAMKSVPGYPGVSAIYLYREEITRDDLHVVQHYERIKILTEKGKSYANVELGFVSASGDGNYASENRTVGDIAGRTIHPDGTVVPFTGKPYLKTMEKTSSYKYQAQVFTLPDVEVGSIIEYRYASRYNDMLFDAARWYLQSELFTRAAHYVWYPTSQSMQDGEGNSINSITWFPILPEGVTLQQKESPQRTYEVSLKDVPPIPDEEYMPPIKSFTYRVLFSFSAYRTGAEFWKAEGKRWSKKANSFIGPDKALSAATQPIIAGASTESGGDGPREYGLHAGPRAQRRQGGRAQGDQDRGRRSEAWQGRQPGVELSVHWDGAGCGYEGLRHGSAEPGTSSFYARLVEQLPAVLEYGCDRERRRQGAVLRSR